jgi:Predicted nucleotide-binding protein containing TIR-like domain
VNGRDDLLRRKRIHFHGTGFHPEWSSSKAPQILESVRASLNARTVNTTADMLDQWSATVTSIADAHSTRDAVSRPLADRQLLHAYRLLRGDSFLTFVDRAYDLPFRLADHAFLWDVVQSVDAFQIATPSEVAAPFERALAFYWTYSHLQEYRTSIIGHDYQVGWIDCGIRYDHPNLSFDLAAFTRMLQMVGLADILLPTNVADLLALKSDTVAGAAISGVLLPWFAELTQHSRRRDEVLSMLRRAAHTLPDPAAGQLQTDRHRRFEYLLLMADIGAPAEMASTSVAADLTKASTSRMGQKTVFIGHGRSHIWMQLRDLLSNRLCLSFEEFNRVPVAGRTAVERLQEMLDGSDFAFVILTGEDETSDGTVRARQNAVHELGLFQGRLGFDRAIVLLEDGCEEFSNLAGLQELRFPPGNIMAVSEDVRRILEERL